MARYDSLTDLPNRAFFDETLQRALTRHKLPLQAALYIDLDHFKLINDSLGHGIGDQVLKQAAFRIESCVGLHDIVARLGGDEFAVLLPDITDWQSAIDVADAIIGKIAQAVFIDDVNIAMSASVGLAFAPDDAKTADDLLRYADLALYDAKERGRNCHSIYSPEMYEAAQARRLIEADLRTAVSCNQLELYYQPLVKIEDDSIIGYEALLRWNHPEQGQIQPAVFIPIAEETGLIVEIGEWVIRNALQEVALWPEHLSVAVNLSPTQMRSPNLIPTVMDALAVNGVAPGRLEMEITESVLMQDTEANLAILHQLKAAGIRIALDDFGTGYSSLNYLRSFPFNKIKIDRCFVDGIAERNDSRAIIHAVIGLANSLGMVTTAEGVERKDQLFELKIEGCHQAQGFLYSRPVPASEIFDRKAEAA
jgi:diguanylate cyclase (GGDEF)-like protein